MRFFGLCKDFARKLFEPATGVSGKERRVPACTGTGGADGIDFRRNDSRSRLLSPKHPDDVPCRPSGVAERCRQESPAPCGGRTLAGIHRYLGRSADSTPTFGASIERIRGTFAETHLAKRCKRVSLRSSFSASTTAPRTSCSGRTEPVVCFCALLFRLRLRRSPPSAMFE